MKQLLLMTTLAGAFFCAAADVNGAQEGDAYIASTTNGTIYAIDTGCFIGATTAIFADFEFLARTADIGKTYQQFVFNATGTKGQARIYINGSSGTGNLAWSFTESSNSTEFVSTGVKMTPGTRYRMTIDGVARKTTLEYNGVTKVQNFPSGLATAVTTSSIKIFSDNGMTGHAAMMKLYRFTVSENGVVVHDYVPALRDGQPGLHDTETGAFLTDYDRTIGVKGTEFECGGAIEDVGGGYLEAAGTVGMNSRYHISGDSRVEVDFALTDTNKGQRVWGASVNGTSTMAAFYLNTSYNYSFLSSEANTATTITSTGKKGNFFRHTAIYDLKQKSAALMTGALTSWEDNALLDGAVPTTASTIPVGLFADCTNTAGTAFSTHYANARIYGVRFFTNGELVNDYIPYVKNGVAGFKDRKDGAFIVSATRIATSFGGNISFDGCPAYLESDGTQAINTGYHMTNKARIETDLAYTSIELQKACIFGNWHKDCLYNQMGAYIIVMDKIRAV